jgi:hypothetical protein
VAHLLVVTLFCTFGCNSGPENEVSTATLVSKRRVSDRAANLDGVVPILQYHRVVANAGKYDRTPEDFRNDLKRVYDLGFRPVSLMSYLDNKMDLPPGASPIVFTFDDSSISQFRILENGEIDPECAVGIWLEFAKEHPDFPLIATFYIMPNPFFGQPKFAERKAELLREWGCEIGNHTMTHPNLSKLSDDEAKKEIAEVIDFANRFGFRVDSIALPMGIFPKNRELVKKFTYKGKTYAMRAALLVGANPAPSPSSEKLDPYRIPRIQAVEGDYGITYWLDKIEKGEVKTFVAP